MGINPRKIRFVEGGIVMKSLLIAIKPKWCAAIMNGEKTIEVRKNKALATAIQKLIDKYGHADIYVYCTKDKKGYLTEYCGKETNEHLYWSFDLGKANGLNGKVVFKFRCYKVEEIELNKNHFVNEQYSTDELDYEELLEQSCLTYKELDDYLQCEIGYAIHISDLEIFDKPKELSEFKSYKKFVSYDYTYTKKYIDWELRPLTKAPQNFCYIEE